MASVLAEPMKRLYRDGKITKEQVAERMESRKISKEDYEYIIGEKYEERQAAVEPA